MNLEESIRNVVEGKTIKEGTFDSKGPFIDEISAVDAMYDEMHEAFEALVMVLDDSDDANNIKAATALGRVDDTIGNTWKSFAKIAKKL